MMKRNYWYKNSNKYARSVEESVLTEINWIMIKLAFHLSNLQINKTKGLNSILNRSSKGIQNMNSISFLREREVMLEGDCSLYLLFNIIII